ncbi:fungal-specific transcription factor domain-containing protein [Cantharellus anzutake]|uniref:fungal-specific transcription factor domain-containing protein n=1 Tax=Cantharellus anzutake TaxID=1750568 RepID=UPI0019057F3E|nr:fungal-specific transcription factor domain-containing protein [Cantharellus anzutake]KAF8326863.1 fungal-specific transcription factor domain-containing protein [Cantharellus anzutake]
MVGRLRACTIKRWITVILAVSDLSNPATRFHSVSFLDFLDGFLSLTVDLCVFRRTAPSTHALEAAHTSSLGTDGTGSTAGLGGGGVSPPSLGASPSGAQGPLSMSIELPPIPVQHHLAKVYLQCVHPIFPLLSRTSILSRATKSRTLILALCSYCACLTPFDDEDSNPIAKAMGTGDASRIVADMWYEQARANVMNQNVRRSADLETIQALLFLALRDQGRGKENQAWILMGVAVRMSQDLGLHLSSSAWVEVSDETKDMRCRVWGVVCILDLLLSLQLGRPSVILDAQWATEIPISNPPPPDAGHPQSLENFNTPAPHFFSHTASLCLVISHINFQLYHSSKNNSEGDGIPSLDKLAPLKAELDQWHVRLPPELRISMGHSASLPTLDVNLLYHVAIILMYRPFRSHPAVPNALQITLEAASAFNVLLSYYPTVQRFSRSNPHLIYLAFTNSIAHLSGIKMLRTSPSQTPSSTAINTHIHLINCVDALKEMSSTWPLAERCHRIMLGLMNDDGISMSAPSSSQGSYSGHEASGARPTLNQSGPSNFSASNAPAPQYHPSFSRHSAQGRVSPDGSSANSIGAPCSPSSSPDHHRRRRRVDEGTSESNKRRRSVSGSTAPSFDISSPASAVRSENSGSSPAFFSVPTQASSGSTPIAQTYMTTWDRTVATNPSERNEAAETTGHSAAATSFKGLGFEGYIPDFDIFSGTGWTAPSSNPENGQLEPSSFAPPGE